MDEYGLAYMSMSRGKNRSKVRVEGMQGSTDEERRRFFASRFVTSPKALLLQVALGGTKTVTTDAVFEAVRSINTNDDTWAAAGQ